VRINGGVLADCYSTGAVSGDDYVGGLVGDNGIRGKPGGGPKAVPFPGTVSRCYSTGRVVANEGTGGLVGRHLCGEIIASFWDIEASGQVTSAGGIGKTTAEMQKAGTFLAAGWDFVDEAANGREDIWWILKGRDYPRFAWQPFVVPWASSPEPQDRALDAPLQLVLSWRTGTNAFAHDIYLAQDETAVANATTESESIYRGRQAVDITTHDPGVLEWGKTYYWRIDEVNDADPNSPCKGSVWSFTTTDHVLLLVVDDFESYADDSDHIWRTWKDGLYVDANNPGNGTGSTVGYMEPPFAEQNIVYLGRQSMPMDYNNVREPWYSEAQRTWETSQDWTIDGAATLTLYFRGEWSNEREPLYVGIEDSAGRMAVIVHPDAKAVLLTEWQKWHIGFSELRAAGVDVAAVKKMVIGVGDRNNRKPGGTGRIYIDDIRLTQRMP